MTSGIRHWRQPAGLVLDCAVVYLAWQVTYLFRLGFDRWLSARPAYDHWVTLGILSIYALTLVALRVPRSMWRFTGFGDVVRLALACVIAGFISALVVAGLLQLRPVPRAVLALHPFVVLMGLCGIRLLVRLIMEHRRQRDPAAQGPVRRALVLGAGEAARRLIAGIHRQGWEVLGLLDDDPQKVGRTVSRIPVLGPIEAAAELARTLEVTHLVMAMPSVTGQRRRRIVDLACRSGLPLLTVPSASELLAGMQADRVRDIDAEDLLGREPVALDEAGIGQLLAGGVVAITGAGGSIGSELCLQVARYRPQALLLIESSEYALYRVQLSLQRQFPELALVACIADVKDERVMGSLFSRHRPAVVFHAAAYKHVPLVETGNALAALRNNTVGTFVTAQAAAAAQVRRFVLVSTDKAVNPTNVMGATKRAAELMLACAADRHPHTRFMAVRFGNVLGSSGSVIPLFKQQIAQGGPITVTHPEVIRYFMTIPEACRLVLQASVVGHSAEVLILDMGEPLKIADLAHTMVRLSGLRAQDVPIVYTGLRPGEKLVEELTRSDEDTRATEVAAVRAARLRVLPRDVADAWLEAIAGLPVDDDQAVRHHLQRIVPEYRQAGPA